MRKSNKKGFTIVELVIVIAVIAILSAVLIPTFSGITTKAQESAAKQEARNAYTQYIAEMDDYTNGIPAIDYVFDGTNYYDVDGEFAASATVTDTEYTYLDISGETPAIVEFPTEEVEEG